METNSRHIALSIHVRGLVQGVGFRPFIYRLAHVFRISGWVENRNDGVKIHAEGYKDDIDFFVHAIRSEAPGAAFIRHLETSEADVDGFEGFQIRKSQDASEEVTDISPDIAVCEECLRDMKRQPHRMDYPFINCTNCGPRFTIISDLPYDREKTTMNVFPMCETCRQEYGDILDRRFHAQPVACNRCGPHYSYADGEGVLEDIHEIIEKTARDISSGKIVALKGLGGFNLACDAFNESAARELRARKNRDGKPFAVMFRDIDALEEYLEVKSAERKTLLSWRRPIVILKNKEGERSLAGSVSNGFRTTGAMLPYMPFHFLLFARLESPAIVLTSGNISDEPILIDNLLARDKLHHVFDSLVTYNREIRNRTDDSVMMVVNEKARLIRRSRGFVPSPVELNLSTEGIFAAGAELVNCFCIGKGKQAILSQHIGDLKNLETLDFYEESVARFSRMFRFTPSVFAVDLHPDYLSGRYCMQQSNDGKAIPLTYVQHHHAHLASCMAEHGLDEQVIGLSLDGVGYGTDGNSWGFEIMTCDLEDFERRFHPAYMPQPGGDLTTKEPWRMGLSLLYSVYGEHFISLPLRINREIDHEKLLLVADTIKKGIHAPLTCSAGRLFDGIAAILGVCLHSSFHAEAPMRLEHVIRSGNNGPYAFQIRGEEIFFDQVITQIVKDITKGRDPAEISARFHNTVADTLFKACLDIRQKTGLDKVVLSGGTFQNRFLLFNVEESLSSAGFKVYSQQQAPSNDGGIALGQLAVAAKRLQSGKI